MLPYSRRLFLKRVAIFVPTLYVCKGGAVALSHLHPDAASWRRRVVTNGGNYTSKSIVCNDWMVKALVANQLRLNVARMNTYTGIGLNSLKTALIIDIDRGLDNLQGLDEADYSEGTGVTSGGASDEWIISGCQQKDLTDINDGGVNAWHYGAYVCASNNQSGFGMGVFGGTDFTYLYVSNVAGHSFFNPGQAANQIDVADSAGSGFYCGSYNDGGANKQKLFKRGAEIGSGSATGTASNFAILVGIMDTNSGSGGVAVSTKTWGGYTMGRRIQTTAEQVALNYIWQRGMGILGRAAA